MSTPYAQDRAYGHKATTHFFLELLRQYFHFFRFWKFFWWSVFCSWCKIKTNCAINIAESKVFTSAGGNLSHAEYSSYIQALPTSSSSPKNLDFFRCLQTRRKWKKILSLLCLPAFICFLACNLYFSHVYNFFAVCIYPALLRIIGISSKTASLEQL